MYKLVFFITAAACLSACGLIDRMHKPENGVYVGRMLSQNNDSDELKPNQYAYVTHEKPGGSVKLGLSYFPKIGSTGEELVSNRSFDELKPGAYEIRVNVDGLVRETRRVSNVVGGVNRFFEIREDRQIASEPVNLSVRFEAGYVYEIGIDGDLGSTLRLVVRKLNPDNFGFIPKHFYLVDKRLAEDFKSSESDVVEIVASKILYP